MTKVIVLSHKTDMKETEPFQGQVYYDQNNEKNLFLLATTVRRHWPLKNKIPIYMNKVKDKAHVMLGQI